MLILALASYLILSTGVFHYLEGFKYYDQIWRQLNNLIYSNGFIISTI